LSPLNLSGLNLETRILSFKDKIYKLESLKLSADGYKINYNIFSGADCKTPDTGLVRKVEGKIL